MYKYNYINIIINKIKFNIFGNMVRISGKLRYSNPDLVLTDPKFYYITAFRRPNILIDTKKKYFSVIM